MVQFSSILGGLGPSTMFQNFSLSSGYLRNYQGKGVAANAKGSIGGTCCAMAVWPEICARRVALLCAEWWVCIEVQ